MNSVNLIGRVVNEIELRYTPSGKQVARFTIAIDKGYSKERRLEEEIKEKPTADFFNIVVWGKLAEFIVKHSSKGKLIGINGRLQSGSYENKEGKKVYTTEVVANNVDILEWNVKEELEKN